MPLSIYRRLLAVAVLLVGISTALAYSKPGSQPSDYTFELVDREIKQGAGTTIVVRLVDERTGKVVPDATLFISRIDMSPDGMGAMAAPLEPLPDSLPGYFRFETNLTMRGGWALTLAAKVPGVSGAIQSRLVLQAVP